MVRLAINAVSNLSGGGVTTLVGYLTAWEAIGADLDVTVYASHERTMDAVRSARPDVHVEPFAVGRSTAGRLFALQARLGAAIGARGAEVILSTNLRVERTAIPQIVHHQSLLLFDDGSLSRSARHGLKRVLQVYGARRALRRASINVFISDFVRREAEAMVPGSRNRNVVIPNGLSDDVIRGAARPSSWDGEPRLLAVTSDDPHKDNDTLVRTVAELVSRRGDVNWSMIVAGAGTFGHEKALAERLGVAGHLRWPGFVESEELDRLYRGSLCLVHPAPREGFGLALLEAMARRCAVVAANAAAVPQVVGSAAVLVEARDPAGFAGAICDLLDNPGRRRELIESGVRRVADFRWVDSAHRFLEVIRRLANSSDDGADTPC